MSRPLRIEKGSRGRSEPPYRGKLMNAIQVGEMIGRKDDWVRKHVPRKMTLGHSTVRWYEHDVLDWLEQLRSDDAA